MVRFNTAVLFLLLSCRLTAQQDIDTIAPRALGEVIIIVPKKQLYEQQFKSLATLDEYLQGAGKIALIRRGAYAWEPMINNMATERTVVTIDGMHIFGACTDKMDPVTSYVEISNLAQAEVCSGQQGSHFGATIGGALDLKRNASNFQAKGWDFGLNNGFEANNRQQIAGLSVTYAHPSYYLDADITIREAGNYTDGNGREIKHSGFKKINFSHTLGWKFQAHQFLEAALIFDRATEVGYPALPMDVLLAQAWIGSLKYVAVFKEEPSLKLETKIYYNTITHQMDDTTRPDAPIHMDMPGWSRTGGFYAQLEQTQKKHRWQFQLNSFYNQSLAEMTMYPKNPAERAMFMYTWPDVRTWYSGLFLQDSFTLNCHAELKLTASVGIHQNTVASPFGRASLQIFYPHMTEQQNRWLKSIGLQYHRVHQQLEWSLGTAYSERAPSVSEGYGFYLFNSSDRFDYIGNPHLKTESAFEINGLLGYKTTQANYQFTAHAFHIQDYIIGQPRADFIPMTLGATGVKLYQALSYAQLVNLDLTAQYKIFVPLWCSAQIKYSSGQDSKHQDLPLLQPLAYQLSLTWQRPPFSSRLETVGNAAQTRYGQAYGAHPTNPFSVYNFNISYLLKSSQTRWLIKLGAENLTDQYYTTYSDWNKIPRMGRNVFIHVTAHF